MQTSIIMYYDIIIEKMIPGIFIVQNNKTTEGYLDSFLYLKKYIDNIINYDTNKIKFKIFTTDFELALFNAFNIVFNKDNKIKHTGRYFHYLKNKYLSFMKNLIIFLIFSIKNTIYLKKNYMILYCILIPLG